VIEPGKPKEEDHVKVHKFKHFLLVCNSYSYNERNE